MIKRLIPALVAGALAVPVAATVGPAIVSAATCRDSNGSAPGGSVYLYYSSSDDGFCTVRPDQRLHLLRTPSSRACVAVGGRGWVASQRICWDTNH